MKEIYVIKELFGGGYRATTLEEIEELSQKITLVKVTLTGVNPDVTINLYEEVLLGFFGIPEGKAESMVEDYINYVVSITGFGIEVD